jgi:hypothetical protein
MSSGSSGKNFNVFFDISKATKGDSPRIHFYSCEPVGFISIYLKQTIPCFFIVSVPGIGGSQKDRYRDNQDTLLK